MEFLRDIFQYGYLGNAIIACILCGILCGIAGTYVVCRRMVFLSGGITHASFGGLGIAFYFGANPILGALFFAIASSLGIEWASNKGKIREDSAIGIIWGFGMAVGALFMSLRAGYTSGDLSSYMFGNIITVTAADTIALAVLTLAVIVGAALWLRPVMYVAFDRSYAATQGIHTQIVSYTMSALLAVIIVLSIRIMGIVLLISLLTMPVVIVNSFTKSYRAITVWSAVTAAAASLAGVTLSYYLEVPSGASIIFILTITLISIKLLPLRKRAEIG